MWIFCLFLFNTFVFVKLYRLLPVLQKTPFVALFPFRRAIRRLAPQGGKALRVARQRNTRARIPAHCRARGLRVHLWRAKRRLAPQGGKALHSALRAPLEHESLRTVVREVLLRFLMARHAKRDTAVPCNACFAAASRHKEACPARGQSSSLRSSTNPYALPRARSSRTFMAHQKAPRFRAP